DNTPDVGTNVTFTITVSNAGPSASSGVTVGEVLPNGYSVVSSSTANGSYKRGTGVGTLTNPIPSGSTPTVQNVARVLAAGNYNNYAQVLTSGFDPDSTPGNNSTTEDDDDTIIVTPNPVSDLSLTKNANTNSPLVGSNITFTITVSNAGPSASSGVTV